MTVKAKAVPSGRVGTYVYLGRKPCGCAVAAIVEKPETAREIQRELPRWIGRGWVVDRVSLDDARRQLRPCRCAPENTDGNT